VTLKKALIVSTMLALPLAAQAQPIEGLYVGAGAGLNLRQHDTGGFAILPPTSYDIRYDSGFGGVLSVGWGFGNGLRLEAEGSYRRNSPNRWTGDQPGRIDFYNITGVDGRAETYGLMLNLLYDFDIGLGFTPYVGGGVGWMWNAYSIRGRFVRGPSESYGEHLMGTGNNFAYQAILGAALPIAEAPGLSLTAEYRFLGTLEMDHRWAEEGFAPARARTDSVLQHSLFFGVRYAFGTPWR
jgi:opacity protein-like surface antigen